MIRPTLPSSVRMVQSGIPIVFEPAQLEDGRHNSRAGIPPRILHAHHGHRHLSRHQQAWKRICLGKRPQPWPGVGYRPAKISLRACAVVAGRRKQGRSLRLHRSSPIDSARPRRAALAPLKGVEQRFMGTLQVADRVMHSLAIQGDQCSRQVAEKPAIQKLGYG